MAEDVKDPNEAHEKDLIRGEDHPPFKLTEAGNKEPPQYVPYKITNAGK